MFYTGQWALRPLPFSVQPLLCFLLTALAEQPTAEAACFFVKQRDSSPLCLCLLMCCPLYFIWTGSWKLLFNSQSSTWSPDQRFEEKYKNFYLIDPFALVYLLEEALEPLEPSHGHHSTFSSRPSKSLSSPSGLSTPTSPNRVGNFGHGVKKRNQKGVKLKSKSFVSS